MLAEGFAAWGRYRTAMRDSVGSVQAHAKAIALRPSYAGPHQWSCWANLLMNRGQEARRFGEKAVRLDPLDPEAAGNLAVANLMVGEPELALEQTRRILQIHPRFEYSLWAEALALQALGRWDEAADTMARLRDRWTAGWPELARAAALYQAGGEGAVGDTGRGLTGPETGFERGMIAAFRGDIDRAFGLVRNEWPFPWAETLYLYVHKGAPLDLIAVDPRYEELRAEVTASWMVGVPEPAP
jgi:tetratricopeptide (TPR) repeat protein